MFEKFADYMFYLLTTPFKRVKKSINQWYILFSVIGKWFDECKEDLFRARDETMIATCKDEMLPVHAADRSLSRYRGEDCENYRSRIANHEEVCRLGGSDPGILLAVKSLGYEEIDIITAKKLKQDDTRWAEFYVIMNRDVDSVVPISFDILRKEVRRIKEVGAKDNYLFQYRTEISTQEQCNVRFETRFYLYYYKYVQFDEKINFDSSYLFDAEIIQLQLRMQTRYHILHDHQVKTNIGQTIKVMTSTFIQMYSSSKIEIQELQWMKKRNSIRVEVVHQHRITHIRYHETYHLGYFDSTYHFDSIRNFDAYEKTEDL